MSEDSTARLCARQPLNPPLVFIDNKSGSKVALQINGKMEDNQVCIDSDFMNNASGSITFHGVGASVTIRACRPSQHVRIDLGSLSHFQMADGAFIADLHAHLMAGSSCEIGSNSYAIGRAKLFSHEKAAIKVGSGCLIGGDFLCMTSDMHSIVDAVTGVRINPPGDIIVSDTVWIGGEVCLLKKTSIGPGSIIGFRSTVMGEFPANVLLSGFPARLVKSNVTWKPDLMPL